MATIVKALFNNNNNYYYYKKNYDPQNKTNIWMTILWYFYKKEITQSDTIIIIHINLKRYND